MEPIPALVISVSSRPVQSTQQDGVEFPSLVGVWWRGSHLQNCWARHQYGSLRCFVKLIRSITGAEIISQIKFPRNITHGEDRWNTSHLKRAGLSNIFHKEPDSKHLRLCEGPTVSIATAWLRHFVMTVATEYMWANRRQGLYSNKLYFKK